MKRLTKLILLVFLLLTAFTESFSQSSFNVHIGPSIPLTDFGLYPINRGGIEYYSSATIGLDVGFQYSYQFSEKGFGFFTAFDFILNGINKEYKDLASDLADDFSIELKQLPIYLNLPISAGLFYKHNITNSISLYCNSGVTFNFMKVTDFESDIGKSERDWATNLGFKVGVGVFINEKISIGVDYLGLGKHDSVGRRISDTNPTLDFSDELNIQLLTITAGWSF